MKKRKILFSLLIIIVTIGCIVLGYRTRFASRLIVRRLENGYILETSEGNMIVIDGDKENDAVTLKNFLQENGKSNILAWFLTSPQEKNSGALLALMQDPEITISNIYVDLKTKEFYKNSALEQTDLEKLENLMDVLYNEENRNKVIQMERRAQYQLDNCFITPLELADRQILNHVILKLDNTFKNIIFLGDTSVEEWQSKWEERNQDALDYDSIQTYMDEVNPKIALELW